LFGEAVRLILGERFNLVHETASFKLALEYLGAHQHQIDLMIGDPGANPIPEFEVISLITQRFPEAKIIILTEWTSQALLDIALKSGAVGFLSNDISVAALLCSIEIVLLGERIIPTMLPFGPVNMPSVPAPKTLPSFGGSEPVIPLSGREERILHCLVDGMSNRTIADTLSMTESTVKVHLKALLRKLRVQNRTQAAVWALNSGRHRTDSSATGSDGPAGDDEQQQSPDGDPAASDPSPAPNGHLRHSASTRPGGMERPTLITAPIFT
jgi:two-component system nitrate/nitrite response regulator NarL